MAIYRLGDKVPHIDPTAYIHESAVLIGAVQLGPRVSVWPGAVIRADNEAIVIGADSNVQDLCVLHTDPGLPIHIGAGVTVGHQAMLHGCRIDDGALIGIQAVVLNQSVIGRNSLVGACALVTERKEIPEGSMAVGAPAKVLRALSAEEIEQMAQVARSYVQRAALFHAELQRII